MNLSSVIYLSAITPSKGYNMKDLSKQDILNYFEEINHQLRAIGEHGEIIISGGAALALVYNARNSTHDIDAVFKPAEKLRKIIENIARSNDLNEDWLNDGVKGFFTDKMTHSEIIRYSNLTVSSIDTACLLAMKLISARAYSKDMDDSITLMKHLKIENLDQLYNIIEKYISPQLQTPKAKYFAIEAFEKYKNELSLVNNKPAKKSIESVINNAIDRAAEREKASTKNKEERNNERADLL